MAGMKRKAGERAFLCRIAEGSRDRGDMVSGMVLEATQEYFPVGKTTYHEHLNALTKAGAGRKRGCRLQRPDETRKNPD